MAEDLFDTCPFQAEAVNENALRSLPCPPVTAQDFSDEDDGPSGSSPNQLTASQVDSALAPGKDDQAVKLVIRQQQMHFKSPLRGKIWKAIYIRMEAEAGNTSDKFNAISLAEATAGLYHDTIQTCFGTQDLVQDDIDLPSCVEQKLTSCFYLSSKGKRSVARILTCFAYNQPDIQYCPMLYPIASILHHYLSGIQFIYVLETQ